jgi:hypothetical protein
MVVTRFSFRSVALISLASALVACGASPAASSTPANGAAPAASAEVAAVVAGTPVLFPELPLKGVVAGDAKGIKIDPLEMHNLGAVGANGGFVAHVRKAESWDPATQADAEAEILRQYTGKNIKFEKLPDGWIVTFDNTSKDGSSKNFWVSSRRTLGGADYVCDAMERTPELRASVAAFCKTLTPK